MAKLPKIRSLGDLRDPKYHNLTILAAENLGCWGKPTYEKALEWLFLEARETTEEGVIDEVNFCR
jgi:hypothetical protein